MRTTDKPFIIDKTRVYEAYKAVKSNAGAAGVDGQTIEQFEAGLQNNLYKLWNRMSSGSYFPPPVRAVSIPKLGFSHSRGVSKCIFHALPDMARNFYAVSAWPGHERNLVMPDFATHSRDCIAECQDRFWIPCGGSRFEFL